MWIHSINATLSRSLRATGRRHSVGQGARHEHFVRLVVGRGRVPSEWWLCKLRSGFGKSSFKHRNAARTAPQTRDICPPAAMQVSTASVLTSGWLPQLCASGA